jgi:hypothetical protein
MPDSPQDLRRRAERLRQELRRTEDALARAERTCRHQWDDPQGKPNHIHHEGYHVAGDPPGTMGVDRQLPMDVPSRTEKRWTRTCQKCGKVEHTQRTEEVVTHKPRW